MDAVGGGGIAFSPDSKRFAFIGAKGREARLYLDRKPTGGKMHEVSNAKPEFSPDGSRIAWLGARGGKYLVCEAESEGKPYDAVITGSIMFSPDSKHLAYVAERDRQAVVVVDGAESPLYEDGGKIVFVTPEHLRAIVQRFDKMFREELIMVDIELGGGETEVRK
jgi:sugar lactone lactonase YvrE